MKKQELEAKLNPKEKLFCTLYATRNGFFGNGTRAYCEAYGKNPVKKPEYDLARNKSSQMLAKGYISDYVDILIEETLAAPKHMDALCFKIAYDESEKTADRMMAIREINRVNMRGQKIDVNHTGNFTVICKQFLPGEK